MAATLECRTTILRVFHCGPLVRYRTCLRVEYRTGCRFHAFIYSALFPIDLALSRSFPGFCAAFFTVTLTRR